jgi:hypothetical protein
MGEQRMPKEVIRDVAGQYDVQVGWSHEPTGHVQVGIETNDGLSIAKHLTDPDEGTTAADFTGLWGTVDREGVNRLIRVLRRARDAAFGADA